MTRSAIPFSQAAPTIPAGARDRVYEPAASWVDRQNLGPVLQPYLASLLVLTGAEAGLIRVLSEDGKNMQLLLRQGLPAAALGAETPLSMSLSHDGQLVGECELFLAAKAGLDPHTRPALHLIGQLLGLVLHRARGEHERLRSNLRRERQRMIGEVHDVLAQSLSFARMRLPLLHDAILAPDGPAALKYLAEVKKTVGDAHTGLRELMSDFRGRPDPLGLMHAMEGLAGNLYERSGIRLEIKNSRPQLGLNDTQETQVFRIVQEALANVAKHSSATRAVVSIDGSPGQLVVLIEDDGIGLPGTDDAPPPSGSADSARLGLGIMRSRAQSLGGSVDVCAREGGGTRVQLRLPINALAVEGGR